jgi:mannose/fructose-specific phosphotransferase system component IIA
MMFGNHGISASPDGAFRAWVGDSIEGAYEPDLASEIDSEEEILADLLGITPAQALRVQAWHEQECKKVAGEHREAFGRVIAFLLQGKNLPVMVHALAFAAGLDQLNGKKSQAQIARELNCTRALVSHYVVGFADILGVQVTKFRKSESSREKFREAQLNRRRGA